MKYTSIFRLILFFFSVVAICTMLVWVFDKPLVRSFDSFLVKRYVQSYTSRFDGISKLISQDRDEGIEQLEDFLTDLSGIKKLDRLDPVKRKGFILLIKYLQESGEILKAYEWAEKWTNFDDRDLFAQVLKAKMLLQLPGRENKGKELITELFIKAPELLMIADAYGEMLVANNESVEAFLAIEKNVRYQPNVSAYEWEVFWDIGKGFNAEHRERVLPSLGKHGSFQLRLTLPDDVKKIRFDPPPVLELIISNPQLSINDHVNLFNLWELPLKLQQMKQEKNELFTTGGNDPFFRFTMPKIESKEVNAIRFTANVTQSYAKLNTITKILKSPQLNDFKKQLELIDKLDTFKALTRKSDVLSTQVANKTKPPLKTGGYPFDLFWQANNDRHFSVKRRKRVFIKKPKEGSRHNFDIVFPIAGNVTKLRLDLPEKQALKYTINEFIVQGEVNTTLIDLNKIDILQSHSIEKNANIFKVTGVDPYFVFVIPDKSMFIKNVQVKGSVK